MRLRRAGKRLLLVLFGTVLGLAIGELGVRALGFEEELARRSTVFDPRYGTVRADSWVFDFQIDHGDDEVDLRGQRVPLDVAPDETRVLFVGDSGTEGVRLPLDHTFPLQLQGMLDEERPGHGVLAINAGVFGMTTIDELHFLEQDLLPLDPDVVVVGLFMANDINFNLGHTERLRTVEPGTTWGRELVRRSALANLLYLRAVSLNSRYRWLGSDDVAEESVVRRDVALVDEHGFHMLSYPLGEVATYLKEPSPLVEHAFEVLENVLWRMRRLGRDNGFEVRVLVIPTPSAVSRRLTLLHYPDVWDDLAEAGIEVEPSDLDFDAPTRRVLAICEELDLVCLDPTPRMREIGMDVFFPDDEHPTRTGHAVLARELLESWDRVAPAP